MICRATHSSGSIAVKFGTPSDTINDTSSFLFVLQTTVTMVSTFINESTILDLYLC